MPFEHVESFHFDLVEDMQLSLASADSQLLAVGRPYKRTHHIVSAEITEFNDFVIAC
jgi:hypothetical protein